MELRPYQESAIVNCLQALREKQTALVVMPTGTGKTVVFTTLLKHYLPMGRALIIAHRDILLRQAWNAVYNILGIEAETEMGELWANESRESILKSPVVLSTIQTQNSGRNGNGRMTRFDPMDFSIVIIDECHHISSKSYRKVKDYYCKNPNLKIVGVTATPDRLDEKKIGDILGAPVFEYQIGEAIDDGWLVPIRQKFVAIEDLDFSWMSRTAGDLNGKELAEEMERERAVQEVASATLQVCRAEKKTLVFASSVKHGRLICEILCRPKFLEMHNVDVPASNICRFVCGDTPKTERDDIIAGYNSRKFPILVNVAVATEGFDSPDTDIVVVARPTESRALYAQIIGRGTRPLPGIVDGVFNAEDRKMAIALSAKQSLLVVDFCGKNGKHKLVYTADIIGDGKYTDEVIERVKKRQKKEGGISDVDAALLAEKRALELEEAEKEIRKQREKLAGKAKFRMRDGNPFSLLNISMARTGNWYAGQRPTERAVAFLERQGIPPVEIEKMSGGQAGRLVKSMIGRFKRGLATYKQVRLLKKFGIDATEMSIAEASHEIDRCLKKK